MEAVTFENEVKQYLFLKNNKEKIIKLAVDNESKTGYVKLYVDENFKLIENSLIFIEGDFNKNEYILLKTETPKNKENINNAFFIYYSVFWFNSKTRLDIKELILQTNN
jgi:hypothetical protein